MLHKFLVFAFLLTCWTPFAHAQASPPISIQKQSDVRQGRRVDYAGRWNSYGSARHVYVLGFMDGDANGSERAVAFFQGRSNPGAVTEWLDSTYIFAGFTVGVLADAMSDIYKNPANSYIPFAEVLYLAKDRIEGKSIEAKLLQARQRAFQP